MGSVHEEFDNILEVILNYAKNVDAQILLYFYDTVNNLLVAISISFTTSKEIYTFLKKH